MKRMTRKDRQRKTQMQIRDIVYILSFALILAGLYKTILFPLTLHVTKTATVDAQRIISPLPKKVTPTPTVYQVQYQDKRIGMLKDYLEQQGSPLASFAQEIVNDSDQNGIDWTLLTAIAGKESGYCHFIPQGSYNCWGLGGASSPMYFASYEDAIAYEAQLLGSDYRYNAISGIQYKYCPTTECNQSWASDVTMFSQEILASK